MPDILKKIAAQSVPLLMTIILLSLSGCWSAVSSHHSAGIKTLEYYHRWTHADFSARYAWLNHLLPAAQAELPPEYQEAFSLLINVDHRAQKLELSWHEQMVQDDASHHHKTKQTGKAEYQALMALLNQPIACETQVEIGWVGPAPKYLELEYTEHRDRLYVGGARGPEGPGRALAEKERRRFLCQDELLDFLQKQIRSLK